MTEAQKIIEVFLELLDAQEKWATLDHYGEPDGRVDITHELVQLVGKDFAKEAAEFYKKKRLQQGVPEQFSGNSLLEEAIENYGK